MAMPTLMTLSTEIQMQIVGFCDLDTKKVWRATCKALHFAACMLPLSQVYLAAHDQTLRAVQGLCGDQRYRTRATGLVIDILMFNGYAPSDKELHTMYVDKQGLRKAGQNIWSLDSARTEYWQLCVAQQGCIIDRQGDRFRQVLLNCLRELQNVETISMTDQFFRWYYIDGPRSWDMKSAPFPTYSSPYTLGLLTLTLMSGLWQTRETRQPKTKSFVTKILGDINNPRTIAGLPYDAVCWGAKSLIKNDNSVFRGVFNGFEHHSIDISQLRHYRGYGKHVRRLANHIKLEKKREEWLGIGKMLVGAENLLSLDLRLQDGILKEAHFEAVSSQSRLISP